MIHSSSTPAHGASSATAAPGDDSLQVFELAAELFGVLSSPLRLRIVSALCLGELSVGQLLERVPTTQPNLSQHLAVLYRAGVLGRRRDGTQVIYRIGNASAAAVCRTVCVDLAASTGTR
jgi:ArsR family transcriptional regulator